MDKGLNLMKNYEKIERVFTKDDKLIDFLTNKEKYSKKNKWYSQHTYLINSLKVFINITKHLKSEIW